jgi:type II secretory pathway pseudopilin PulG
MYRYLRNKSEQGNTLVELVMGIAIIAIIYAGVSGVLSESAKSWIANSTRINYIQEQQETNSLFQVINDEVKFANAVPTVSSLTTITYIKNDPTKTTATPITYTMYTSGNNTALVRDQIPSVGATNLFNILFYSISFSPPPAADINDTQSIIVTVKKTSTSPPQQMVISRGGFQQ